MKGRCAAVERSGPSTEVHRPERNLEWPRRWRPSHQRVREDQRVSSDVLERLRSCLSPSDGERTNQLDARAHLTSGRSRTSATIAKAGGSVGLTGCAYNNSLNLVWPLATNRLIAVRPSFTASASPEA